MRASIATVLVPAFLITGCATKNYGRLQPLSGVERAAYTCRDIDIEIAKVEAFQQQIVEGAQFNMASVLGILGDYGIGNSIERGAAERSAIVRLNELKGLRAQKGCPGSTITAADRVAAGQYVSSFGRAGMSTDPADPPGTILTGRVKLIPANTLSGYCIKAEPGYIGTNSANAPTATKARPLCT
jgi:hypothetical protein